MYSSSIEKVDTDKSSIYFKRMLDLSVAIPIFIVLLPVLVLIFALVKLTSKGPGIYWSSRLTVNNQVFRMPKFRTLRTDTPEVSSDRLSNPSQYYTPIGRFLRKTSLDELPQLWSIIKGQMSLVGPRPAMANQFDLITLRNKYKLYQILPGVSGWAQVNGRDSNNNYKKVELDHFYMQNMSLKFDVKIISMTAVRVIKQMDISH